ncbi:MAG: transcription-repair coupling factor [Oligoflexia bacterium]|nr:transcription-repair coupling factor [Oligoflexia bacterium]
MATRRSSSGIDIICRSLKELSAPVRVHGANGSAQALIAARLAIQDRTSGGTPWIFIVQDDDSAADFASDVESLCAVIRETNAGPVEICHFPTWEMSPFSPVAPSIRTRLARLGVLSDISQGKTPAITITTLPALVQATLPRAAFLRFSVPLATGEDAGSREALAARLIEAGYLRVDPAEDPGTFAVRGDIIDVFPPDRERPLRIELFDTVIERIREYDPASQRTLSGPESDLSKAFLPPAREVLVNAQTSGRLRERLKERADDTGVSRSVRDPVLSSVQHSAYPEHSDIWASYAYEKAETLLDYLGGAARIAWVDEMGGQQSWDQFLDEQKKLCAEAPAAGLIAPQVDQVFLWTPAVDGAIRAASRLYLDRVQLTTAEDIPTQETEAEPQEAQEESVSTHHRVFVRGNQDLAQGSRYSLGQLEPKFRLWMKQGFRIIALASTQSQLERMRFLFEENGLTAHTEPSLPPTPGLIVLKIGSISEGFRWPAEGLVILNESEVLGAKHKRTQRRQSNAESGSAARDWSGLQALSDLGVGDAVVHVDHGIGRYQGLVRLDLSGAPMDFLLLEYANKDKLYLPVYRLNVIQKYVGAGESVALDKLGGQQFAKTKEKVREAVKKLAIDLIQLYAERKIRPGIRFSGRDALFQEFEAKFPFEETPDQIKAIDKTLEDMESGRVMDRLVCGDVGYGKTEVAMRAAFRAVSDGKQVAVLVPTTVLAFQHDQSFRNRMKDYPIQIDSLSRFKSAKEQKRVLASVASGKADIVIGTHRLLSKDVKFHDLGLVIVDEEHRFGVEHKERLKTLKINTHVLTLTATPIPRTLHLALAGLRDISLIQTPPVDRLPIRTHVAKFDEGLIKRAIEFELSRGGQVFVLHNRVQTIQELANRIHELVPSASVSVGHGQMSEGELEKVMVDFYQGKSNVLVCTTIIESGLDVPSANTIIINRADSLGLAQLYQIRGRVGRGQQRAYAYLLIPAEGAVTGDAKRRLEVIQKFVELGSGFSVASHDLDIRGGGDLLGAQQSGHIAAVGFDLYTELLEEAITDLSHRQKTGEEPAVSSHEPEIKAPFAAYLGEDYVPDIHQRLSLYRRFSAAKEEAEIDRLEEELLDRFGPLPAEAHHLLWMIRVKLLLKRAGIEILTVGPERVSMVIGRGGKLDPARTIALVASQPSKYQLTPDSKFVAQIPTGSLRDLYFGLEALLRGLSVT